jgi:sugar phosphate isomerase/epimerase
MDQIGFHIRVPEHFNDIRKVIEDGVNKVIGVGDNSHDGITLPVPRVFQIFIADPNGYQMFFRDVELRKQFKDYIESKGIFLVVHARYLDVPWKQSPQVIGYMKKEFERSLEIGAKGFVIHLYSMDPSVCSSNDPSVSWLDIMVTTFEKLNPPKDLCIYLENPASRTKCYDGTTKQHVIGSMYSDPHVLVKIYKTLAIKHHFNVGLCIDTAHLYSTGVSMETSKAVKSFFGILLKHIPKNKIIIHLNDSASKLGSFIDRHASLGHGNIWSNTKDGLTTLLEYGFPCILEREYESLPQDYNTIRHITAPTHSSISISIPISQTDLLYNVLGGDISHIVRYL